jgi:hypothetical protein
MKNWYALDLSAIKPPLTEGTTVEYWMEAQDANNISGPGVTESEHHTIKVVSELEKAAELMSRAEEALTVISDINDRQAVVNKDLGSAIQGKQPEQK